MFAAGFDPGPSRAARRALSLAIVAATVLVVARSAVFLVWEQAGFDSDQAIMGLMAKHIVEARAFPMFLYGAEYLLAVEAWLAAPLFAVFGPSVAALKTPLVLVNIATTAMLVWVLHRDGRLSPAAAFLASLFYVAAPPALATLLVNNSGGNPEPILYVLLLWVLRDRPLAFGVVFALGFVQREFTVYGPIAIVVLAVMNDRRITAERLRAVALATVGYLIVWQVVRSGFLFSTPFGPGAPISAPLGAGETFEGLAGRSCVSPATILPGLGGLFGNYLGVVFGATDLPLSDLSVRSHLRTSLPGVPAFWPALGAVFAIALARVGWLSWRTGMPIWRGRAAVATYLLLVGLQAGVVYAVTRCGQLDVGNLRYALLMLYTGVGVVALFFIYETERRWQWPMAGLVLAWTLVSGAVHARLLNEYRYREPQSPHRELATYLVNNGIHYARSDYWTAYATTFLAREQVVIASTQVVRINSYQKAVAAQPDAFTVQREACASPGGTEAIRGLYWVCPDRRH